MKYFLLQLMFDPTFIIFEITIKYLCKLFSVSLERLSALIPSNCIFLLHSVCTLFITLHLPFFSHSKLHPRVNSLFIFQCQFSVSPSTHLCILHQIQFYYLLLDGHFPLLFLSELNSTTN